MVWRLSNLPVVADIVRVHQLWDYGEVVLYLICSELGPDARPECPIEPRHNRRF